MISVHQAQSPKHLVRLAGDYDLTRKDELAAVFAQLDDSREIVIDMRDVTYLDSTVLRELAALHVKNPQRSVSLLGVEEPIRRILSIVGFDRILDIA
jgi:anti-anti-sigma factor